MTFSVSEFVINKSIVTAIHSIWTEPPLVMTQIALSSLVMISPNASYTNK